MNYLGHLGAVIRGHCSLNTAATHYWSQPMELLFLLTPKSLTSGHIMPVHAWSQSDFDYLHKIGTRFRLAGPTVAPVGLADGWLL